MSDGYKANVINSFGGDPDGVLTPYFQRFTPDMMDFAGPVSAPAAPVAAPTGGLYAAPIGYTAQSAYTPLDPDAYKNYKKEGAQKLNADVTRAQWADYETRFQPVENIALGLMRGKNTADLGYDLERTRQTIDSTAANYQAQQGRAMDRFGLGMKGGIGGTVDTASAMVGGLNAARFADEARRMNMISGGSGGGE